MQQKIDNHRPFHRLNREHNNLSNSLPDRANSKSSSRNQTNNRLNDSIGHNNNSNKLQSKKSQHSLTMALLTSINVDIGQLKTDFNQLSGRISVLENCRSPKQQIKRR